MSVVVGAVRGNYEFDQYVPRRYREQGAPELDRQPFVASQSTVPSAPELDRLRRARSDRALWPDPIPEPAQSRGESFLALLGRVALLAGFAGATALLVVFGKPILETVRPLLAADSQSTEGAKSGERITTSQ